MRRAGFSGTGQSQHMDGTEISSIGDLIRRPRLRMRNCAEQQIGASAA